MRTSRTLTLRKESLTDLTPADLAQVAAGQQATVPCPYSAVDCIKRDLSAVLAHCPFAV